MFKNFRNPHTVLILVVQGKRRMCISDRDLLVIFCPSYKPLLKGVDVSKPKSGFIQKAM